MPEFRTTMSQAEVRRTFKADWKGQCRKNPHLKTDRAAMREAFTAYVDSLCRSGEISNFVADRVTLE